MLEVEAFHLVVKNKTKSKHGALDDKIPMAHTPLSSSKCRRFEIGEYSVGGKFGVALCLVAVQLLFGWVVVAMVVVVVVVVVMMGVLVVVMVAMVVVTLMTVVTVVVTVALVVVMTVATAMAVVAENQR